MRKKKKRAALKEHTGLHPHVSKNTRLTSLNKEIETSDNPK